MGREGSHDPYTHLDEFPEVVKRNIVLYAITEVKRKTSFLYKVPYTS